MNLPPGTYTVNEVIQPGWVQTAPPSGVHTVTLGSAQSINGLDFGNQPCVQIQCGPLSDLTITQNPPANTPVGPGTHVITVTVTDPDG